MGRWFAYLRQTLLFVWSFAANFAIGMTLYLTRETGLLHWALDAERLAPGVWSSTLLIGGGIAFGSIVLAVTGRFTERLHPAIQVSLNLILGIWTIQILVIPFASDWLTDDGGYEAYASTWFFVGWAITQFAAAWLLVDDDGNARAPSSA